MSKTVVNGVTVTRTTVVGVQGPPGPAGPAGAQGVDGAPGADGSNVVWRGAWDVGTTYSELDGVQHNGSAWVATDAVQVGDEPGTAASWELWVSKGDTGAQGPQGDPGSDGAAATITVGTVTTGAAGSDATVTNTGTSSAAVFDFSIPQGAKGDTGEAGADGDDGREVELQVSATHVQWRYEGDTEWINLVALADLKGEKGDTGETGAGGATGETGADGKTVLSGSGAPDSGAGVDGDFYVDTSAWDIYGPKTSGAWGSGTSLVGPQGEQGPQGETGPAGATTADGVSYDNNSSGLAADDVQAAVDELATEKADASSLAAVATSGAYSDLFGTPTLGTAAAADTGDFATAAQGAKADAALSKLATVNSYAGNRTLDSSDSGGYVRITAAGTVTLPNDLATGYQAVIVNATDASEVALSAATSLSIPTGFEAKIQNRRAVTVIHVGSNVWEAHGALEETP